MDDIHTDNLAQQKRRDLLELQRPFIPSEYDASQNYANEIDQLCKQNVYSSFPAIAHEVGYIIGKHIHDLQRNQLG